MFYISVKFKLEKREWKIVDFFERRWFNAEKRSRDRDRFIL
jgi:hypothetical protein